MTVCKQTDLLFVLIYSPWILHWLNWDIKAYLIQQRMSLTPDRKRYISNLSNSYSVNGLLFALRFQLNESPYAAVPLISTRMGWEWGQAYSNVGFHVIQAVSCVTRYRLKSMVVHVLTSLCVKADTFSHSSEVWPTVNCFSSSIFKRSHLCHTKAALIW